MILSMIRERMPAWILDENGAAALALHEGRDIGMAEWTLKHGDGPIACDHHRELRAAAMNLRTQITRV